ncbi:hypothetical protein GE300_10115 [Rhodobacteraceae bacterium 2CG4]|uniref:Uncharacterized protein n=1 Tax=Halovulum marinum TaxID=2662447 RepID=A0A6L5Z093_9RHOB|nr:hypothetical protein [Halovulum marinum]MSU89963.1 hypothetical protein [Halovulum marinum]
MAFLGASIIAGVIYFVLSFLSGLYLSGPDVTTVSALVQAVVKTAVFVTLFHYAHNWIARLLGWYRIDQPEGRHTFDRNPALDQVREEGGR